MSEQKQPEKDWRDSEPFDAKKYKNFYQLVGGAFITLMILLIGGFIYSRPEAGYWVNIYATLVGTILTIAVLDRRAEQRAIRERKEELILQMGSSDNGFALEAVRLLGHKGWLRDGSLRNARLIGANLQTSRLIKANLEASILIGANLGEVNLYKANLQGANLLSANLKGADLTSANLKEVILGENSAQIISTGLKLMLPFDPINAPLNISLARAEFSPETRLPDGKHWSSDRDLREFTHPDDWKAEQVAKQSRSSA
jgi:Pentapeptide repeats (8 copies)